MLTQKTNSTAIMQPYFFPYLGYFQLMQAVQTFVIFDDVNYINKGFINRNFILLNKQAHRITLPLNKASQNKLINEIELDNNKNNILKTIEMAYKKAPYFQETFDLLNYIFMAPHRNLAHFIASSLQTIAKTLGMNTTFINSSSIKKNTVLTAQDKIIAICKQVNTQTYINAIGGKELYSKQAFTEQKIDLFFIKSRLPSYKQFTNEFIPNLSIIDVLMFNKKEEVLQMLRQYDLIN